MQLTVFVFFLFFSSMFQCDFVREINHSTKLHCNSICMITLRTVGRFGEGDEVDFAVFYIVLAKLTSVDGFKFVINYMIEDILCKCTKLYTQ